MSRRCRKDSGESARDAVVRCVRQESRVSSLFLGKRQCCYERERELGQSRCAAFGQVLIPPVELSYLISF